VGQTHRRQALTQPWQDLRRLRLVIPESIPMIGRAMYRPVLSTARFGGGGGLQARTIQRCRADAARFCPSFRLDLSSSL